jgi:hypothetical protein
MPERTCVMISSTILDLPEHRKDVIAQIERNVGNHAIVIHLTRDRV